MINTRQKLPFNLWKPVVSEEEVFSDATDFESIKVVGKRVYWLESRPAEKGRIIIIQRDPSGTLTNIIPEGYYVRTRVHEYGGLAYTVTDKHVFFVNFSDQRIYKQNLAGNCTPVPLTPEMNADGSLGKYAVLSVTSDNKTLVFVYEKEFADKENENYIAAIDLTSKKLNEPKILVDGNDFYGDPVISPDGHHIAWLTWNHPHMPWETTKLMLADLDCEKLVINNVKTIAGGPGVSVCYPKFDSNNTLYFILDEAGKSEDNPKNWWNIYRYNGEQVESVTSELVEFGAPMWTLGRSLYTFLSQDRLVGWYLKGGKSHLGLVNLSTLNLTTLDLDFDSFYSIQVDSEDNLYLIASSPTNPKTIVKLDLKSKKMTVLKTSRDRVIDDEDISVPKAISYPVSDGKKAYAHLYLPKNSNYEAPDDDRPPLLVMVHGGPTGRVYTDFSVYKQFWTSQGYAVLDVDYRGSTGYGRQYRDDLYGKWGVIDTEDIKDAVTFLINEQIVAKKVTIRGGSAGGYAVQRALTLYPDLFQCGASYFGIGNLFTLVKLIHKFESHYIFSLIGVNLPEGEQVFNERSPINSLDNLKSPMIILQGSDDKIVTPENSREIVKMLEKLGIEHEYIEYEGETHGFRRKENQIDALKREAAFFKRILYKK
ncbi:MAG: prolyl oligopeptidase family serine peptidase [Candidatus Odinarchaeota archaeon]